MTWMAKGTTVHAVIEWGEESDLPKPISNFGGSSGVSYLELGLEDSGGLLRDPSTSEPGMGLEPLFRGPSTSRWSGLYARRNPTSFEHYNKSNILSFSEFAMFLLS